MADIRLILDTRIELLCPNCGSDTFKPRDPEEGFWACAKCGTECYGPGPGDPMSFNEGDYLSSDVLEDEIW